MEEIALKQKKYPKTVRLRSGFLSVLGLIFLMILMMVLRNMLFVPPSIHRGGDNPHEIERMASPLDNQWAQQATTLSPLALSKASLKPVTTFVTLNTFPPEPNEPVVKTHEPEMIQKAMSAPIGANELKNQKVFPEDANATKVSPFPSPNPSSDLHEAFLMAQQTQTQDRLLDTVQPPLSPYMLQAGTVVSGILLKAVQSDLPDQIIGQVQNNLYDTVTGQYLLIPQGSKLLGVYDPTLQYGQTRLQVVWKRILFPNGTSLDLGGMTGDDRSGQSGFAGTVNHHYGSLWGAALLTSVLSAGAQLSQPQNLQNSFAAPSVNQVMAQSLGTNIANTGTMLVSKGLNIPPTMTIQAGYPFIIQINKDIIFPSAYQAL